MRRRSFLAGAAACVAWPAAADPALLETRTYFGCTPAFREALSACLAEAGIDASTHLEHGNLVCTVRFTSLGERHTAWDRVNVLPAWRAAAALFRGYRFELHT